MVAKFRKEREEREREGDRQREREREGSREGGRKGGRERERERERKERGRMLSQRQLESSLLRSAPGCHGSLAPVRARSWARQ
jgi:hypothetical protein